MHTMWVKFWYLLAESVYNLYHTGRSKFRLSQPGMEEKKETMRRTKQMRSRRERVRKIIHFTMEKHTNSKKILVFNNGWMSVIFDDRIIMFCYLITLIQCLADLLLQIAIGLLYIQAFKNSGCLWYGNGKQYKKAMYIHGILGPVHRY